MTYFRVQHTFQAKSGLAQDGIVNTFHFTGGAAADVTSGQVLVANIQSFYEAGPTSNETLMRYIAARTMMSGRHRYKCYDLGQLTPRVPFYEVELPGSAASDAAALPSEVAVCLSYKGVQVSGTNRARTRGRLFIGPLNGFANEEDVTNDVSRPSLELQQALVGAANRLADDSLADSLVWSVYSPTTDGEAAGLGGMTPITTVWVDNAFDIQRRRGVDATSRLSFDVNA